MIQLQSSDVAVRREPERTPRRFMWAEVVGMLSLSKRRLPLPEARPHKIPGRFALPRWSFDRQSALANVRSPAALKIGLLGSGSGEVTHRLSTGGRSHNPRGWLHTQARGLAKASMGIPRGADPPAYATARAGEAFG